MGMTCLCLCFLIISSLLASCIESVQSPVESSNKDELPAPVTTNKKLYDEQKVALNVILFEQPIEEVQRKPFRIQPKLFMNNTVEKVNKNFNESQLFYYVTATLKHNSNVSSLIGDDTQVQFFNDWANFSNLAVSHFGQRYRLEFSIYSSDNDSCLSTVISSPFDIAEFPFHVYMLTTDPVQLTLETFRIVILLSLWDFTTNMFAHPNSLNDTIWHYTIALRQIGSPVNVDEINGSFPLRKNRTPPLVFNLTQVGYRYRFHVTIHSPSFTTRLTNISEPFDVVGRVSEYYSNYSTIALTFNGSSTEIYGVEELFWTIFLNDFGRRHPDVWWTKCTFRKSEEIVVQVTLVGRTDDVDDTVDNIWQDVENSHYMEFRNTTFVLQNKFEVDGVPYLFTGNNNADVTSSGLSVTAVFTIVFMSFLFSSFVLLAHRFD